jgi:hypothetical protein
VGSHGPTGGGLSSRSLECGPDMPEGRGSVEWRSCVPVDCWPSRLQGHDPYRDLAGLCRHEGKAA